MSQPCFSDKLAPNAAPSGANARARSRVIITCKLTTQQYVQRLIRTQKLTPREGHRNLDENSKRETRKALNS